MRAGEELLSKILGIVHDGADDQQGFAVRLPPWMKNPIRADVLMMEGMQFLDESPRFRAKFPAGDFRVFRKRNAKVDPEALPAEERLVWEAIEFSDDPRRIFRSPGCCRDDSGFSDCRHRIPCLSLHDRHEG